jgi:hypothetical protein
MRKTAIGAVFIAALLLVVTGYGRPSSRERHLRCGNATHLVRSKWGGRVAKLWKKIEIYGFSQNRRAWVTTGRTAPLFARVTRPFRGIAKVRAFFCRTGERVHFWMPEGPNGTGSVWYSVKWLEGEGISTPYDTDLFVSVRRRGKYRIVATWKGKKVGSIVIRAVRRR